MQQRAAAIRGRRLRCISSVSAVGSMEPPGFGTGIGSLPGTNRSFNIITASARVSVPSPSRKVDGARDSHQRFLTYPCNSIFPAIVIHDEHRAAVSMKSQLDLDWWISSIGSLVVSPVKRTDGISGSRRSIENRQVDASYICSGPIRSSSPVGQRAGASAGTEQFPSHLQPIFLASN